MTAMFSRSVIEEELPCFDSDLYYRDELASMVTAGYLPYMSSRFTIIIFENQHSHAKATMRCLVIGEDLDDEKMTRKQLPVDGSAIKKGNLSRTHGCRRLEMFKESCRRSA